VCSLQTDCANGGDCGCLNRIGGPATCAQSSLSSRRCNATRDCPQGSHCIDSTPRRCSKPCLP
jgi:hypothetical protein